MSGSDTEKAVVWEHDENQVVIKFGMVPHVSILSKIECSNSS
jgi:hypothetical protein